MYNCQYTVHQVISWFTRRFLLLDDRIFSGYSGFLHQWNWPPQYNWNKFCHASITRPVILFYLHCYSLWLCLFIFRLFMLSRACIVHLVIKRTNWSYVKTMSCSGSHLGIPIYIKNTKFVKDLYKARCFHADWKSKLATISSHRFMGDPVANQSLEGPLQTLCFLCRSEFHQNKKPKLCRGPSNEHSCTIQSALRFETFFPYGPMLN
jgi:hypothetical protein